MIYERTTVINFQDKQVTEVEGQSEIIYLEGETKVEVNAKRNKILPFMR